MGDREIRAKYGGHLAKAINRAIRAEIPGGNQALDKLTELAGAARQSGWKDHKGRNTPEAVAYHNHQKNVVDRMDAEVRKRWGVPPGLGMDKNYAADLKAAAKSRKEKGAIPLEAIKAELTTGAKPPRPTKRGR